jgi:hypothetical protein
MLTSESRLARIAATAALALLLAVGPAVADDIGVPPEEAFVEGMAAYRAGDSGRALPLLDHAAREGHFLAQFRLAHIYSDPRGGHSNEVAAFHLFEQIAESNRDVDPYLNRRAPYVARAFIAVGRYWQSGIDEAGMAPDPARARDYFEYAASYFDNADAQFELAKLSLADPADTDAVSAGLHWLSTLAEKRDHTGAQAYLGDLFWNGQHVARRPALGLALVTIALSGALPGDRLWIEDLHQRIYCGASANVRSRAGDIVEKWLAARTPSGRDAAADPDSIIEADLDRLSLLGAATRTCASGEIITVPQQRLTAPELDDVNEAPPVEAEEILAETNEAVPVGSGDTGESPGTFSGAMGLGFTSKDEAGVSAPQE